MKTEFETAKYTKYTKADEVAPASWTAPVLWRFWIESHTFASAFCWPAAKSTHHQINPAPAIFCAPSPFVYFACFAVPTPLFI